MTAYKMPFLGDIPFIGPIFFQHNAMVYVSYALIGRRCAGFSSGHAPG